MAIEFGRFVPERLSGKRVDRVHVAAAQPDDVSVVKEHERLLNFYGLRQAVLDSEHTDKPSQFPTDDGPLTIYWDQKAIVPPPNYLLRANSPNLYTIVAFR